jgi:hypothetical protein
MKSRISHKTAVLFLILTLLTAGLDAGAQSLPKREEISEELATLVRNKRETIELEASNLPNDEWVGSYRSFDGPTISTNLSWSPASGFMVWWENCSRPWTARVNHGSAVLTNGSLKLIPELSENSLSSYSIPSEFIPVKWGEQHFLIPSDKMINFAYAVNSTSIQEVESFLIKIEDYEKDRKGLPNVPLAYRKYLGMKPITAMISGFGPKVERWYPKVILNAGRAEGVVREMKFYLSRPSNIYMQLEVTDVQEHTSEAFIITTRFRDNREEDIKLKVGWKFTSRAPKDNSQFQPG